MKRVVIFLLLIINISFADDSLGVVRDKSAHLEWQDSPEVSEKINIWKMAKAHCESMYYKGFNDWRLPSKSELLRLAKSKSLKKGFSYLGDYLYWSKDEEKEDELNAYVVYLPNGFVSLSDKCEKNYALCVRDIK